MAFSLNQPVRFFFISYNCGNTTVSGNYLDTMTNHTISVRTNYFTRDSYIKEMSLLVAKEKSFSLSAIDIRQRFEIEEKIIEDLLTNHSAVDYGTYKTLSEYSKRCDVIQKAILKKEAFIQNIIVQDFNAETTEYKNVFLLNSRNILEFVSRFYNEVFIDWQGISKIETISWNAKLIEEGKLVWDWFELQINPILIDFFNDLEIIKKYDRFLNWDIISSDSRINWSTEYIKLFKDKINFSTIQDERLKHNSAIQNVQKCFINNGQPCGLSMNPNLEILTIIENERLWNWEYLSSNPAILKGDDFFQNHLEKIDLYGLCHNRGLKIEHMRFLRAMYINVDKSSYFPELKFKDKNIKWRFYWKYAFENAIIDWQVSEVEDFFTILEETSPVGGGNWDGISKSITNKDVIIKYADKLSFLILALNNPEIIWDVELTNLLIKSNISLSTDKFSKALPDILEKINITEDAIMTHKEYWKTPYYWSYWHRNSDGTEKITVEVPLWHCLKQNQFVNWTKKISSLFDN